jgi:transposase-like protein
MVLENVIVSLYAKGMSNSDIEEQIRKCIILMFPPVLSLKSQIVFQAILFAWQNRPLDPVYLIVWMDIVFKVRENSKVINKTIYLAVGLNRRQEKCSECGQAIATEVNTRSVLEYFEKGFDFN